MRIDKLKPFIGKSRVLIPPMGYDDKHISISVFPENNQFLEVYNFLEIKPNYIKYVFVPKTTKPISRLTNDYRKQLMEYKLKPVTGSFGSYGKLTGKNFYIDIGQYTSLVEKRWKLTKYNTGRGKEYITSIINTMNSIPKDTHNKILLYTVDLTKHINPKFMHRRIFPVYLMLRDKEEVPFDKFILYFYNENGGRYVLLWDKDTPVSIPRIKAFLMKLQTDSEESFEEEEEEIIQIRTSKQINHVREPEILAAIDRYAEVDKSVQNTSANDVNTLDVATKAVVYSSTGNIDLAKKISKNASKEDKKKIISNYSKYILKRPKPRLLTDDPILKMSDPFDLVDGQVPTHILEKRKTDFSENLGNDLNDMFKTLSKKKVPLKLKGIKRRTKKDSVSEIQPSMKDIYEITLEDPEGKQHVTEIKFPHLNENGTFLINGEQKILINQIITYPIFFFKPYFGSFSSSYSMFQVNSKQIKKGAYLLINQFGGQKAPAISILSYKLGFKKALKMFGVTYKLGEKPEEKSQVSIKLPDNKIISFFYNEENEVGRQFVNGINYINLTDKKLDIDSEEYWKQTLVKHTGTRNAIYLIDEVWTNIVTPIETEVLTAHGDPTKLDEIIKYMCDKVIEGYVDDRNSLEKQRIRTSEIFTSLLWKQIQSAYNEYLNKRMGGDDSARFELQADKVFSDVMQSQNIQSLENINPMEEISMMTRITPVGIGGIPDKRALPDRARNIHNTYYGNIDPLESPVGEQVGIVQHLTVGTSLVNRRGMFGMKDQSTVQKSEMLSMGPASIPFVDSDDGARVTMAAGQMKQALPLVDPEAPAVQTGYESLLTDMLGSDFIKKSPTSGEIVEITDRFIKIKSSKNGKMHVIDITPKILKSGQGKHGISTFIHDLKLGKKVKEGDVLAEGSHIKGGVVATGLNLLTAIMPWKGYNFEDGVVMSETASKKFTSLHIAEETMIIDEGEDVVSIVEKGEVLEKGGILMTKTSAFGDVESYKHLRTDGGKVEDIQIFVNAEDVPDNLRDRFNEFRKDFISVNGKYPQGKFKEKGRKIEGILVRFTLRQELGIILGDKVNNRHFNKGVTSYIVPDDMMPVTPWGDKVEFILNPIGIVNRMNPGQLAELHCGMISKKLGDLIQSATRAQFTSTYSKVMKLLDGTDDMSYSSKLIKKFKSMSDKGYKDLVSRVSKTGFITVVVPPFKTPPRENIKKALQLLDSDTTFKLYLPEYKKKTEPVAVGYLYEQKLEHMSSKKLSARASGGYVSKTMAPSKVTKGEGPQKLGENDVYSLLSWDCPIVAEELLGPLSTDHATKNQIISEIVQTGKGEFKKTKSTPVKDMMDQYMLGIHLTSM